MKSPLRIIGGEVRRTGAAHAANAVGVRVAYDRAAFEGGELPDGTLAQFTQVQFAPMTESWTTGSFGGSDVLIVHADAANGDIERLRTNLRQSGAPERVIVVLRSGDLQTTRTLMRDGVADVLAAPVSELSLGTSLDRVLDRVAAAGGGGGGPGQVYAFLKAGGGSGATSLATQTGVVLAQNGGKRVCVVDLDIQFGQAAFYLDVHGSVSMAEVLSAGDIAEIGFDTALPTHASGLRVLAAPPEFMPLEALTPHHIDALLGALRRKFDVVLLDLPIAWTAWTYRTLRQSDHIVLVTQLTVPHCHLAMRQLTLISTQRLDDIPLTLVCNRAGGDNPTSVSQRSVQGAIGRSFDIVAPEDRKLMNEAINQGVGLSTLRRGSKLEKAIIELANRLAPARGDIDRLRGKR